MAHVRRCEFCGKQLEHHDSGRPPKYCSAVCRKKASRGDQQPVNVFRALAPVEPIRPPAPPAAAGDGSRLEFLIKQRDRLDRMLNECAPERAAALAKEFRDTLREIDELNELAKKEQRRGDRVSAGHRSFEASSI